jgi:hypothetical protein
MRHQTQPTHLQGLNLCLGISDSSGLLPGCIVLGQLVRRVLVSTRQLLLHRQQQLPGQLVRLLRWMVMVVSGGSRTLATWLESAAACHRSHPA